MSGILSSIKAVFSADTAPLKRGVDDSKKALNNLKSEGGGAITDMANRIGIDMKGIQDTFGTINKISGSLALGFKGAATASTSLSGAMKVLKLALVSTGLGALVVLLGSLVAYFMRTKEGSDKLSQAWKAFGAVIAVLTDRVSAFGAAFVKALENPKKLISDIGDFIVTNLFNRIKAIPLVFEKAWALVMAIFNDQTMADASKDLVQATVQLSSGFDAVQQNKILSYLKDVGGEMEKEAKKAYELQESLNKLNEVEIAMSVSLSARRTKIQELLAAAKEENRSKAEQIRLMEEAKRLIKEVGEEEMYFANERFMIISEMGTLGNNLRIADKEIADAKIAVLNKEREIYSQLKEVNSQITGLKKASADETQREYDILRKKVLEREKETKLMQPIKAKTEEVEVLKLKPMDNKPLTQAQRDLKEFQDQSTQASIQFSDSLSSLLSATVANMAVGFGEMLGQMMIGEAGMDDMTSMILGVIGGFIAQLGQLLIIAGVGMVNFAALFNNPLTAGPAAIAAGVLLVAVGTAIKGIASSASKSSGSSVSASGGGGTIDTRQNTSTATQVFGEFKIKGADLVAVIGKENVRRATVS